MKKIEAVTFEFENYETIEIDFIFLKELCVQNIVENIVQLNSGHFAKIRTADVFCITIKSCWNPIEKFSDEKIHIHDKFKKDAFKRVDIKYYDDSVDEFDFVGTKINAITDENTGDLHITARKIGVENE